MRINIINNKNKRSLIIITIIFISALQFFNGIFVSYFPSMTNTLSPVILARVIRDNTIVRSAAGQEPQGGDTVAPSGQEDKDKDQSIMPPHDSGAVDQNTPMVEDKRQPFSGTGTILHEDDCDDGIDNDADGAVDSDDKDCRKQEQSNQQDPSFPVTSGSKVCDDGIDNDADGAVDSDDKDCASGSPPPDPDSKEDR